MKKIILFTVVFYFVNTGYGQQLNFLKTVKLINDKIKCCQVYKELQNDTISVTKDTTLIKWKDGKPMPTVSLFLLRDTKGFTFPADEMQIMAEDRGIVLIHDKTLIDYTVSLLRENEDGVLIGIFKNKKDAETVYQAMLRLRLMY